MDRCGGKVSSSLLEVIPRSLPNSIHSTLRRQLLWDRRRLSAFVKDGRVFSKGGETDYETKKGGGWFAYRPAALQEVKPMRTLDELKRVTS